MPTENLTDQQPAPAKKRWYQQLYFWVLVAILLGILVGWLAPSTGEAMEPIGTTFISWTTHKRQSAFLNLLRPNPQPRRNLA